MTHSTLAALPRHPQTLLILAHTDALRLAALAELLAQEISSRFVDERDADGPDLGGVADLLAAALAAHRDDLERLLDYSPPGERTQAA